MIQHNSFHWTRGFFVYFRRLGYSSLLIFGILTVFIERAGFFYFSHLGYSLLLIFWIFWLIGIFHLNNFMMHIGWGSSNQLWTYEGCFTRWKDYQPHFLPYINFWTFWWVIWHWISFFIKFYTTYKQGYIDHEGDFEVKIVPPTYDCAWGPFNYDVLTEGDVCVGVCVKNSTILRVIST